MKRQIARYIFTIILILCSVLVIKYRVKHQQYYHFQKVIKKEFPYIERIHFLSYGPCCGLSFYLNKNSCSFEKVEPAFIKIMIEITKESNYQYFLKRHVKDTNGEMPSFHVYFHENKHNAKELYRFTSENVFQLWVLDSDRSIQYNVTDYKE